MTAAEIVASLRAQHLQYERHEDRAHNRRPQRVTVAALRERARRRWWAAMLRKWVQER